MWVTFIFCMSVQLYHPENIYIVLVGVEVWTSGDPITINATEKGQALDEFCAYRQDNINPYHNNDNAQLITWVSLSAARNPLFGANVLHLSGITMPELLPFEVSLSCNANFRISGEKRADINFNLQTIKGMCIPTVCVVWAVNGGDRSNGPTCSDAYGT